MQFLHTCRDIGWICGSGWSAASRDGMHFSMGRSLIFEQCFELKNKGAHRSFVFFIVAEFDTPLQIHILSSAKTSMGLLWGNFGIKLNLGDVIYDTERMP